MWRFKFAKLTDFLIRRPIHTRDGLNPDISDHRVLLQGIHNAESQMKSPYQYNFVAYGIFIQWPLMLPVVLCIPVFEGKTYQLNNYRNAQQFSFHWRSYICGIVSTARVYRCGALMVAWCCNQVHEVAGWALSPGMEHCVGFRPCYQSGLGHVGVYIRLYYSKT